MPRPARRLADVSPAPPSSAVPVAASIEPPPPPPPDIELPWLAEVGVASSATGEHGAIAPVLAVAEPPSLFATDDAAAVDAPAVSRPIFPPAPTPSLGRLSPYWRDDSRGLWLYLGNCLEALDAIAAKHPEGVFDCIFADPPYFLSNGGITCQNGRMVKVDKGTWDKSRGPELNHQFNTEWLRRCRNLLRPHGTLWVSGTHHVIYSVGYALQQLGLKLLNDIIWEKPNPPPNLSCRYFTHSTEILLWAAKSEKSKHTFNYAEMRAENGGKQMKTVWKLGAPTAAEKTHGKHPTQKPLGLLRRVLRASTRPGDLVLDPFAGSGTTAVAAAQLGRRCVLLEQDPAFAQLAVARLQDVELFSADVRSDFSESNVKNNDSEILEINQNNEG